MTPPRPAAAPSAPQLYDASPSLITNSLLGYKEEFGLASEAFKLLSGALFDFMAIRREREDLQTE